MSDKLLNANAWILEWTIAANVASFIVVEDHDEYSH
jgi:hypothetical protein